MNEALALYGDEVDALVGKKSQNVTQDQREVPSQTYHPRSVSTLVLDLVDNEFLSKDTKIEESTPTPKDSHFMSCLSLEVKNFFTLPYLIDSNTTKDDYIKFLENLKKTLEETDNYVTSKFKKEMLEYIMLRSHIRILFGQILENSLDLEDFKKECREKGPEFLQEAFI
jgi:hypothetical protein